MPPELWLLRRDIRRRIGTRTGWRPVGSASFFAPTRDQPVVEQACRAQADPCAADAPSDVLPGPHADQENQSESNAEQQDAGRAVPVTRFQAVLAAVVCETGCGLERRRVGLRRG